MQIKQFNYTALIKATATLKIAIKKYEELKDNDELRDFIRDSVIQRFEFSFELSWKILKRFLEVFMLENVDNLIGANLFRMGFEAGLIRDPSQWNGFKKK